MKLPLNDMMIAGCAVAFFVILFVAIAGNSPKAALSKRAGKLNKRYIVTTKTVSDATTLRRQQKAKVSRLTEILMKPLPNMGTLENLLNRAGSKLHAKQFLLRSLIFIGIGATTCAVLGKNPLFGIFGGFIFGFWLPVKYLRMKINKRNKKFLQVFPDAIDLIVRGLRSGLPVSESINLVATEVPEPVGSVFKNLADTMRLGVPMEKALQDTARQLASTEFNFFTTSIVIQRETGGNLAEILNNLSEVIRKRFMMRMKIHSMTSEARASSIIIGALPFLVTGAVVVMNPDYIKILWTDYRGNIAVLVAAGMLTTGVWSMNRMAKFDI